MRADAGNEQWQLTDNCTHRPQLIGIGGADDESALTDLAPVIGDATSDVLVERLTVRDQRLEVIAAGVTSAA